MGVIQWLGYAAVVYVNMGAVVVTVGIAAHLVAGLGFLDAFAREESNAGIEPTEFGGVPSLLKRVAVLILRWPWLFLRPRE